MQITVAGTHEWSREPELGTVHITVDVEGDDRAATSREASEVVDALARDLLPLRKGEDAALTTYVVGPLITRAWRPYNDRGEIMPLRYGASASLKATFREFTVLSEVTADWAERDGVQLSHVEWDLTDATRAQIEAEALTKAVEEARSRALAVAQAADWESVEVTEVCDPGLLSTPGAPVPMAASGYDRMAFKAERSMGGGGGLAPEDVRGSAVVHARFTALR